MPTRLRSLHVDEVLSLLRGDVGWHHQLPPPGTELLYDSPGGPFVRLPEVAGTPSEGAPGDRWWSSLGSLAFGQYDDVVGTIARWASAFAPEVTAAFSVADLPVVYDQSGVVGGSFMRWLKVILAGDLAGGVEHFQHSFALGKPGADPDLTPAQQLALAEQIAGIWKTQFEDSSRGGGGYSLSGIVGGASKYVEVGVVQLTSSGPTNLVQADATQWFPDTLLSEPIGSSVSLPFEVACAVTLQTNVRGPRGRGRTYLPPFNINQVTAGGQWTAQCAAVTAETWNKFMQALIAALRTSRSSCPRRTRC